MISCTLLDMSPKYIAKQRSYGQAKTQKKIRKPDSENKGHFWNLTSYHLLSKRICLLGSMVLSSTVLELWQKQRISKRFTCIMKVEDDFAAFQQDTVQKYTHLMSEVMAICRNINSDSLTFTYNVKSIHDLTLTYKVKSIHDLTLTWPWPWLMMDRFTRQPAKAWQTFSF